MWHSIIGSAKLNNLNIYGYLMHLLIKLPKPGEGPVEQLDSSTFRAKPPDFCK